MTCGHEHKVICYGLAPLAYFQRNNLSRDRNNFFKCYKYSDSFRETGIITKSNFLVSLTSLTHLEYDRLDP